MLIKNEPMNDQEFDKLKKGDIIFFVNNEKKFYHMILERKDNSFFVDYETVNLQNLGKGNANFAPNWTLYEEVKDGT